jgi:hypothetical protein
LTAIDLQKRLDEEPVEIISELAESNYLRLNKRERKAFCAGMSLATDSQDLDVAERVAELIADLNEYDLREVRDAVIDRLDAAEQEGLTA